MHWENHSPAWPWNERHIAGWRVYCHTLQSVAIHRRTSAQALHLQALPAVRPQIELDARCRFVKDNAT